MTLGNGVEPQPPSRAPSEPRIRSRVELVWRWSLVAGWLVLLAATVVTGTRQASWHDLRSAVADGDVGTVSTTPGLGPHTRGTQPVEVTWRDGVLRYRATVTERRPPARVSPPRVVTDVEETLTELRPDLVVTHHPWVTSTSEVLGWRVSPWISLAGVVLALSTLLLLVTQPPPWRATRWAWFWLLGTPVGIAAYLLLGGPTGIVPPPRDRSRRLTGGWAFLLGMAASSLYSAVVVGLT